MPKRFFAPGHFIRLVHSGKPYFEELGRLIDSAGQTIYLLVYIFDEDETGKLVLHHLEKAASRGVEIYFIADGYGSASLSSNFGERMIKSGINFKFFSPVSIFKTINSGRRLHQKVCVADGKKALVGGINISDKYRGTKSAKPWFDLALYIEGPLCTDLHVMCKNIWEKQYRNKKTGVLHQHLRSGGVMARMVQNDWLRRKNEISSSYKKKLQAASSKIVIAASYFLPSRRFLNILLRAAKKGRNISIILSRDSDVPFIKPAIAYLYNRMLSAGIRIFEYDQSVLHAKAVMVDNRWVSIGSHNLNHLSEYISMELNIEVLDKHFGTLFNHEMELLIKNHCQEVTLDSYEKTNNKFKKLSQWFSYKLVSMSERILDMFTRRIK